MVWAILGGHKTQTRRIIKPQPDWGTHQITQAWEVSAFEVGGVNHRCPCGIPGDRLWVQETWCQPRAAGADFQHPAYLHDVIYAADEGKERHEGCRNWYQSNNDFKWRPSIHMHRCDSRITLVIEAVRVERLQDISDLDAHAEGAEGPRPTYDGNETGEAGPPSFVHGFADIWDSINGDGAWDKNPWVWMIEFRVLP